MKLYRMLVRTSKATGKKFYRHSLPIPEKALKELGWTTSTRLECEVRDEGLFIRKKP